MAHIEPHGYFWQGDTLLAHSPQRENERRYRRRKGAATRG